MGRINVTSPIFAELQGSNNISLCKVTGSLAMALHLALGKALCGTNCNMLKLTWLVLGGDPVARSHRVEQFTAL